MLPYDNKNALLMSLRHTTHASHWKNNINGKLICRNTCCRVMKTKREDHVGCIYGIAYNALLLNHIAFNLWEHIHTTTGYCFNMQNESDDIQKQTKCQCYAL